MATYPNMLTTSLSSILNPRKAQTSFAPMQAAPQADPWAEFDDVAPTSARPGSSVAPLRQIQAPQPKQPAAQTPAQARKDQIDADLAAQKLARGDRPDAPSGYRYTAKGDLEPIPGGPADKAVRARGTATAKVKNVLEKIDAIEKDVTDNGGWGETGLTGSALRMIPGTAAYDLAKNLQTIDANSAFSALQEMREASPTGGALGQVTEKELELLKSTVANLDPNQSQDAFLGNLKTARDFYTGMLTRLEGTDQRKQPGDRAQDPATPSPTAAPGEDVDRSNPLPVGMTPREKEASTEFKLKRITPEQEQAMQHFNAQLVAGAPDDQLLAILSQAFPGDTPTEQTLDMIRQRREPNSLLNRWIAENPGRALPYETQVEVPLSGLESVQSDIAASPLGSYVAGAADIPLAAIEGTAALAGADDFAEDLQTKRDLVAAANPGWNTTGQVLGSFMLPGGSRLRTMIPASGGYGAVHGFGSTSGDIGQRFDNALAEGGLGTLLAGTIGAATRGRAALRSRPPGGDDAVALAEAAAQEGVPVSRPILDPAARNRMAYLDSSIGGGGRVQKAIQTTEDALERRAGDLQGRGTPQEPGLMGQRVQEAMRRDISAQRGAASQVYDRADELAKDMAFYGQEAVRELDKEIARLSRNPNANGGLIDYLQTVRGDFVNEAGDLIPKRIGDIRDIRTSLAQQVDSRNLTRSPAERIVSRVLDRARRDIDRDFNDFRNGSQARDLYREADVRWRLAKRDEKQVAERLLGPADNPITGKAAMDRALQWINSGAEGRTQATRFWEKLNQADQRDFAATIASTFGRRAADEPFSPALFVANTRAIPPSSRALIFGPEGAQSIANLRALSKAFTDATGSLNRSKSGVVINWGNELKSILSRGGLGSIAGTAIGGPVGGAIGGAAGAGGSLLAHSLSARALMNPDLSRWLASAPRQTSPLAIQRHIEKLPGIAGRNPGIANDVIGLRDGLTGMMRSSASGEQGDAAPSDQ